jgi:hypothetical protein
VVAIATVAPGSVSNDGNGLEAQNFMALAIAGLVALA